MVANIVVPQSGKIIYGLASDGTPKPQAVDASGRQSITTPQSVPLVFTGNVPLQSAHLYNAGDCLGGLLTIAGLTAGAIYFGQLIALKVAATVFTSGSASNLAARIFEAAPSGSTFVDGSPAVLVAADRFKAALYMNFAAQGAPIMNVNEPDTWFASMGRSFVADGGGQLYMAWVATAAFQATGPSADYRIELRQ